MSSELVGSSDTITRYQQDDGLRVYVDDITKRNGLSVTTYLKFLDSDKSGLKYWKKKHDGEGDNADWRELLAYAQDRGTLCHAAALSAVTGEDIWTDDEQESLDAVLTADADRLYSVLVNKGMVTSWDEFNHILRDDLTLYDVYQKDEAYFTGIFADYCADRGINEETIVCAEEYVLHYDTAYDAVFGGQLDLLYYDEEASEHVIADLKTSSYLYDDKKLQSAAYAKAAEASPTIPVNTVDRIEVIRISPDKKTHDVHSNVDRSPFHSTKGWDESEDIDALYAEFGELMASVDTEELIQ